MIDASVDPPMIMEYPKRLGAEDQDIQDAEAIMMFEAEHKPGKPSCELLQDLQPNAVLNAQAGLITTRMLSARSIWGQAISPHIVPSDTWKIRQMQ